MLSIPPPPSFPYVPGYSRKTIKDIMNKMGKLMPKLIFLIVLLASLVNIRVREPIRICPACDVMDILEYPRWRMVCLCSSKFRTLSVLSKI